MYGTCQYEGLAQRRPLVQQTKKRRRQSHRRLLTKKRNNNKQTIIYLIEQQQENINLLIKRVTELEAKVTKLEGGLAAASHVASVLEEKLEQQYDEIETYSRRPRMIISGLKKDNRTETVEDLSKEVINVIAEMGLDKNQIKQNIDKLHCVGKFNTQTKTQNVMVKFKTHSFKENAYRKKEDIKRQGIKFKPSLTKHRLNTLVDVHKRIKNHPDSNIDFTYPDVHGNLKLKLKLEEDGKSMIRFNTMEDFEHIFINSFLFNFFSLIFRGISDITLYLSIYNCIVN